MSYLEICQFPQLLFNHLLVYMAPQMLISQFGLRSNEAAFVGDIFEMFDSPIPEQNMLFSHTYTTMLKFHL